MRLCRLCKLLNLFGTDLTKREAAHHWRHFERRNHKNSNMLPYVTVLFYLSEKLGSPGPQEGEPVDFVFVAAGECCERCGQRLQRILLGQRVTPPVNVRSSG